MTKKRVRAGPPRNATALLEQLLVTLMLHVVPGPRGTRATFLAADVELTVAHGRRVEVTTGKRDALEALARHAIGYLQKQGPISAQSDEVAECAFRWRAAPGELAGRLRVEADARGLRIVRLRVDVDRPAPRAIVPDVVGKPWQKALTAVERVGVEISRGAREADAAPAESVLRQTPSAAADVPCGTRVTVDLSTGPPA